MRHVFPKKISKFGQLELAYIYIIYIWAKSFVITIYKQSSKYFCLYQRKPTPFCKSQIIHKTLSMMNSWILFLNIPENKCIRLYSIFINLANRNGGKCIIHLIRLNQFFLDFSSLLKGTSLVVLSSYFLVTLLYINLALFFVCIQ